MKLIVFILVVLGLITMALGLYIGSVASDIDRMAEYRASLTLDQLTSPDGQKGSAELEKLSSLRDTLVIVSCITGGIGLLGGVFTGIMKARRGWVAAQFSVIGIFITLAKGTHMFS